MGSKSISCPPLSQYLRCPISLSEFSEPVLLPGCGHTFDRQCLQSLENNECPTCRFKFNGDVQHFPINWVVANMLNLDIDVVKPSDIINNNFMKMKLHCDKLFNDKISIMEKQAEVELSSKYEQYKKDILLVFKKQIEDQFRDSIKNEIKDELMNNEFTPDKIIVLKDKIRYDITNDITNNIVSEVKTELYKKGDHISIGYETFHDTRSHNSHPKSNRKYGLVESFQFLHNLPNNDFKFKITFYELINQDIFLKCQPESSSFMFILTSNIVVLCTSWHSNNININKIF